MLLGLKTCKFPTIHRSGSNQALDEAGGSRGPAMCGSSSRSFFFVCKSKFSVYVYVWILLWFCLCVWVYIYIWCTIERFPNKKKIPTKHRTTFYFRNATLKPRCCKRYPTDGNRRFPHGKSVYPGDFWPKEAGERHDVFVGFPGFAQCLYPKDWNVEWQDLWRSPVV